MVKGKCSPNTGKRPAKSKSKVVQNRREERFEQMKAKEAHAITKRRLPGERAKVTAKDCTADMVPAIKTKSGFLGERQCRALYRHYVLSKPRPGRPPGKGKQRPTPMKKPKKGPKRQSPAEAQLSQSGHVGLARASRGW